MSETIKSLDRQIKILDWLIVLWFPAVWLVTAGSATWLLYHGHVTGAGWLLACSFGVSVASVFQAVKKKRRPS